MKEQEINKLEGNAKHMSNTILSKISFDPKTHNKTKSHFRNLSSTIFKNIFESESGEVLKSMQLENKLLRDSSSVFNINNDKIINPNNAMTHRPTMKEYKSRNHSESLKSFDSPRKKSSMSVNKKISTFSRYSIDTKKGDNFYITAGGIQNPSNPIINNSPKTMYSNNYMCPFCEHCNKIKDDNLDSYINEVNEAKSTIKKGIEFLIDSNLHKTAYGDLISKIRETQKELVENKNKSSNSSSIIINNNPNSTFLGKKKKLQFNIEEALAKYTKQMNTRTQNALLSKIFHALLEGKLSLEKFTNIEVGEKLKNSFLSKGSAFKNEDLQIIDEEIEKLLDPNTKEELSRLVRKKYLKSYTNNYYALNKETNKKANLDESAKEAEINKKLFLSFLILIQTLSEISTECKEKAVLLYKIFKLYFVELENKWLIVISNMNEKINYYKELCRNVLKTKNKHLPERIEIINDVLFHNKLTKENLMEHKKLIQDLLKLNNEKKEEIFIMRSDIEILNKELRFWTYDFDNLKLNNKIREKFKEVNVQQIYKNVSDEIAHKNLTAEEKAMLINSDKFLIASGQRNYFFEQKQYYMREIERLGLMFEKKNFKKTHYKKNMKELEIKFETEKMRYEKELTFLRDRLSCDRRDFSTQSEIDSTVLRRMEINNDLVVYQKRLSRNKLNHVIEKIKYNHIKYKPLPEKTLLALIPELYNEKMDLDLRHDLENRKRIFFDEFLYKYFDMKFKISKIIKKNIEQTILSVVKYSSEDHRIDLFRRFLNLTEGDRIRREILDCYLTILKNLPLSFYKLFQEDGYTFLMNTDICFEIFHTKLNIFNLVNHTCDSLIKSSKFYEANNNELSETEFSYEAKMDIFLLTKFLNKSFLFVNDIIYEYKENQIQYMDSVKFISQFQVANKEFSNFQSPEKIIRIFERNFIVKSGNIHLESFIHFYLKKLYCKINISDYLETSISTLIYIFSQIEKKISHLFDIVDYKRKEIIFYKEFEELLYKILNPSDLKWKLNDYFKAACGSQDKEFISKAEFISFCLNTDDILSIYVRGVSGESKNLSEKSEN
jgi:hypothetical protein